MDLRLPGGRREAGGEVTRAFQRGAAVLALAALLSPAAAGADELLVMPYACTTVNGQPVLTPGPQQSHRIVGQRNQRKFTACSPVNPDLCRNWTVHRFDLDCDGKRVSWVSVLAATDEGNRRAWLLDGRLLLRMGPRWSLAPDDPCAGEPDADGRFGPRTRRQCADRLAMAPPPMVEMPFGYAPKLGIDAIFVTAALPPDVARAPADLPAIAAGPPATQSSAQSPARPAAAPGAQVRTPERPPLPEQRRAPAVEESRPAPPSPAAPPAAATKPAAAVPVPKAATPPGPATATSPGSQTSQGPRAVALAPERPSQAKADLPPGPAAPPVSEVQKQAPATELSPAAAAVPPAATATPAQAIERPAALSAAEPEAGLSPSLLSLFRTTTTGAIVAFAGLALGLIAAFALARRREHANDVGRRRRDVSALSLDGRNARPSARAGTQRARQGGHNGGRKAEVKPRLGPPSPAPGRSAAANSGTDWGDRMPRTRAEALEVLGIGIAPSATEAAIKKIVDGLRMSWHPDHAKDETDRALRELRSKQINAAWDILQRQRAVV